MRAATNDADSNSASLTRELYRCLPCARHLCPPFFSCAAGTAPNAAESEAGHREYIP